MFKRILLFTFIVSNSLYAQVADSVVAVGVDSVYIEPGDSAMLGAAMDSTRVDSIIEIIQVPVGFYLDYGLGWDSLQDVLDLGVSNELWFESANDWSWTQRQNSSLGGLIYDPLQPWAEASPNGMVGWLSRRQKKPENFLSSAPRFKLYGRTGLGGGQQFGIQAQSPVDSVRQLYVDYERTNALGFYRNEGSDGHELNFLLRTRGVADSSFRNWTESIEITYYTMNTGQNGGLSQIDLFQANVPTLRRNFSVVHSTGEYREDFFNADYIRRFGILEYGVALTSEQWSARNDWSTTEYYWDSTGTEPQLLNRSLTYDDTVSVVGLFGHLGGHYDGNGWIIDFDARGGLERLSSDTQGWDGIRLDSVNSFNSFGTSWSPVVRGELLLQKDWRGWLLDGRYVLNVLGYNFGSLSANTELRKRAGSGELVVGWSFLNQNQMYRWENVYGYSYDFRSVSTPFVRNTVHAEYLAGDQIQFEAGVKGHQLFGLRYLVAEDSLGLYNGVLATARFGIQTEREGINGGLKAYGNYRTGEGGFAVPTWGMRFNGFYQKSIGNRFQLRTGLDFSIEDSFFAPTYLGTQPIWSMQRDVLAESYPWSSVYFEARIGNFIGGARVVNALEGLGPYSYFAYGSTPRTDRWVQLSAKWTLFN